MDSKSLTTKEVARLCLVSDATVKRWEIAGLIESERTNGGHRRFRAEEIARFQLEQNLGVKQKAGDDSVTKAKTRRPADKSLSNCSFFHALIAGSEEEAGNRLINDYLNGVSLTDIFDGLISESMNLIGNLWYEGKLSVAQEHLATRAVLSAIHKLRNVVPIPEPCNKLAICCAIEGDFHELPTHFSQMTLESVGLDVMNFGANTPLFSVADEILHHSPKVVCISSTIIENIERLSREYKDFSEKISSKKTIIILGGHAFANKKIHSRFPADLYPQTFKEVAEFAKQWAS